jgi:hypothetical protein
MFITKKRFQKEFDAININLEEKLNAVRNENYTQAVLQANILNRLNEGNTLEILKNIQLAEFKVFSQWKDDGIIQFLINYLDIESKTFVEFGVQDYKEANTRFLLINDNWTGLVMDGSQANMDFVEKDEIYWKYNLLALTSFVTCENINSILKEHGFDEELGLLHIDIDGNDYWVWKAITVVSPIIVILEYNSIFGQHQPWTIPYQADFYRTNAHHSNLYFGSSLLSLCDLASEKGYTFVGSNSNGNNAYFVRNDKIKSLEPINIENGYVQSQFRESRDINGQLTYINGENRLKELEGMEIYNTRKSIIEKIS